MSYQNLLITENSLRRLATVHYQRRSGHEGRFVGGEEESAVGDFARVSNTLQEVGAGRLCQELFPVRVHELSMTLGGRSEHCAGTDAVDANVVGSKVHREAAGQLHDRALGSVVGNEGWLGYVAAY